MGMVRTLKPFQDILEPRRQESSNFMWISRELHSVVAYKQNVKPTPKLHKQEVLQSPKIREIIERIYREQNVPKEQLEQQVQLILDEIGFNKRLHVIRWLGLVLTKICLKVCSGIYVNEESVMRIKSMMGSTPVVFLPSHRSYADFILMSYVCFTYDIEIPAIAAGMDFHGMWGMGTVLRDTGAFFMRRSISNDSLYWDTFRQYISQLITKGDLPLEFFIEGTRSRSGKSLPPKFGLLSMVLKSYVTAEIPDILFVPINISYDRVLEEKLFAFELLGVPKPKESTSGFFKSLSIIKEQYGNIYMEFAEPVSARHFFRDRINRFHHSMKPTHIQELTPQERDLTSLLAYDIVKMQQKCCVITAFNLVALTLTNNFISGKQPPGIDEVSQDVLWLKTVLETLGALTEVKDVKTDVENALNVHRGLVTISDDSTVGLVRNAVSLSNIDATKLKGHALSQETMTFVIPFVMLQLYVNPILHYLINPAILIVVLRTHGGLSKDALFGHYSFLRSLFTHEFVSLVSQNQLEFHGSIQYMCKLNSVEFTGDKYYLSNSSRLVECLCNVLEPFLFMYYVVCKILSQNSASPCEEKAIIVAAQAQLELLINKSNIFIHPYCLNLNSLAICLDSLVAMAAITRTKINDDLVCYVNIDALYSIVEKMDMYVRVKVTDEELRTAQAKICLESKL